MTGKRDIGLVHKLVAGGFIALPLLFYLVVGLMLPSQASSFYCTGSTRRSAELRGELAECSGPPVWLTLTSQAGIFGGIAAAGTYVRSVRRRQEEAGDAGLTNKS